MRDEGNGTRTVLFVGLARSMAGSTRSLASVLEHSAEVMHRVLAAPPGPFLTYVESNGFADEVIRLDRDKARWLEAARLARWAGSHRRRLVAVHANGLTAVNLSVGAARVGGARLVVWSHESEVSDRTLRTRRLWWGARWAAVSEAGRDLLVGWGVARPDQITVIPNPIGNDVMAEPIDHSEFTVGYLGGARRSKGLHVLPGVVAAARDDIHWEVVLPAPHDDPGVKAISEQLRAVGRSRITVLPATSDVRTLYARIDAVLVPSMRESFGRVAAEAMANGIPVVGSDLPALREVVGDAGRLFPPGDARAAARLIDLFAADPQLRRALGAEGRSRAGAYAPARVVPRLHELYFS